MSVYFPELLYKSGGKQGIIENSTSFDSYGENDKLNWLGENAETRRYVGHGITGAVVPKSKG